MRRVGIAGGRRIIWEPERSHYPLLRRNSHNSSRRLKALCRVDLNGNISLLLNTTSEILAPSDVLPNSSPSSEMVIGSSYGVKEDRSSSFLSFSCPLVFYFISLFCFSPPSLLILLRIWKDAKHFLLPESTQVFKKWWGHKDTGAAERGSCWPILEPFEHQIMEDNNGL